MALSSPDLFDRALRFAAQRHHGQTIPDSELPYVVHLMLVAAETQHAVALDPSLDADLALQCALLHDIIEDTSTRFEEIDEIFGAAVALGVQALTKNSDLDSSAAIPDSIRRIRMQRREVWMVKLADRITNLHAPPASWTPVDCHRYWQEAHQILEALGDASRHLSDRLSARIEAYEIHTRPR